MTILIICLKRKDIWIVFLSDIIYFGVLNWETLKKIEIKINLAWFFGKNNFMSQVTQVGFNFTNIKQKEALKCISKTLLR